MAAVQLNKKFKGKSDIEVYEAALKAIPGAGFEIWKIRELARLVLGIGKHEGHEFRCNVVVSMVDNSAVVTTEANDLDEEILTTLAEKIMGELTQLLD